MFARIAKWLESRRVTKDQDAFAKGYRFGMAAISSGKHSIEELENFADGAFNRTSHEDAFDRGLLQAVSEGEARDA